MDYKSLAEELISLLEKEKEIGTRIGELRRTLSAYVKEAGKLPCGEFEITYKAPQYIGKLDQELLVTVLSTYVKEEDAQIILKASRRERLLPESVYVRRASNHSLKADVPDGPRP